MYDAPPEANNPEDDVGVAQTMPEQVRARGSVKKCAGSSVANASSSARSIVIRYSSLRSDF